MVLQYKNLHVLPISLCILFPVTFIISYCVAVLWGHMVMGIPYISDTGALSPESCVFGQLLNIAALLLATCVYIRHRQISYFSVKEPPSGIPKPVNRIATLFGILSCVGLEVIANFQTSRSGKVHMIGALTCFFATNIYFIFQAAFSWNLCPYINSLRMLYLRAFLSFLSVLLTTSTIVTGSISISLFNGTNLTEILPTDPRLKWYYTSALSEWFLAVTFCLFICTFVQEFRKIYLYSPVIEMEIKHVDNQEAVNVEKV